MMKLKATRVELVKGNFFQAKQKLHSVEYETSTFLEVNQTSSRKLEKFDY